MSLSNELKRIEEIGSIAWALVEDGSFRQARSMLKKIRGSFCVSESDRMITLVEAKILERTGDLMGAKKRILDSICYVWCCPEAFDIISATHPEMDSETGHYYIEVLGGLARLGVFTQFSKNHIGSFDVLANSVDEALQYIDEVCRFGDPGAKLVLTCARNQPHKCDSLHRGIIRAYPFRLHKDHSEADEYDSIC